MTAVDIGAAENIEFCVGSPGRIQMANNDDTIERGSYGDRGVLEANRPDGYGSPSNDQPVRPSQEKVTIPTDFPKRRK
jgi:hypothetical protein